MNEQKRTKNEREFDHWEDESGGNRRYWFDIKGKSGAIARYIKTVNKDEITISFVQEIYNAAAELTELHEKYPVDKGHKKIIK